MLISALVNQGQKHFGVAKGPLILEKILKKYLPIQNHTTLKNNLFNTDKGYQELFSTHKSFLKQKSNHIPVITLGGDHSIGQATVSSSFSEYKNDLLVVWVDAHADIHTDDSTISGNTHGMPLSGVLGLMHNRSAPILKSLDPSNLVYYGIRDIEKPEMNFIRHLGIKHFSNLPELIDYINFKQKKNVHISFDVDALDPHYLDSTGTIAPYGISPEEFIFLYKYISKRSVIRALDVVEFNPELGNYIKSATTMDNIFEGLFH